MARIRAIKPEFWSSPGIETLSMESRLLFIAMWNWADDSGVGVANPRELLGFAFPLDEEIGLVELRRALVGITRVFGVKFYSVAGRRYYSIPSWEKHQKFDRRSKGKHPGPDHPEAIHEHDETAGQEASRETPPSTRGNYTSPRRDSVAGTGEQGNRGRGEQSLKDMSDSGESDDPEPNPQPTSKPTKTRHDYSPEFEEFWKTYPTARGASKYETSKKFDTALKAAPANIIIEGAQRFATDPNLDVEFAPMPTTWLHNRRWEAGPLPARNQQSSQQSLNTPEAWGAITPQPSQEIEPPSEAPFGENIIDHETSWF